MVEDASAKQYLTLAATTIHVHQGRTHAKGLSRQFHQPGHPAIGDERGGPPRSGDWISTDVSLHDQLISPPGWPAGKAHPCHCDTQSHAVELHSQLTNITPLKRSLSRLNREFDILLGRKQSKPNERLLEALTLTTDTESSH